PPRHTPRARDCRGRRRQCWRGWRRALAIPPVFGIVRSASLALLEPGRQPLGQTCSQGLLLRSLDIVGYPIKRNVSALGVIHSEGRAGVTIAWLPDRAGVHQVLRCLG